MNIKEYIENIPMWAKEKNSLNDIREFLANIDIKKENTIPLVHIAGTNGKGSVCAYLSNILIDMGYKVGTFISPHLVNINERIRINMLPISDREFEDLGKYTKNLADNLSKRAFAPPTYFEFLFYMAMKCFYDNKVDFIILETGLGGLLDVTNAIEKKDLCVISSISKDHEQYLGSSIEEIVKQKAGILRKNISLVYDNNTPLVEKSMEEEALSYEVKETLKLSNFSKYIEGADLYKELASLKISYKIKNSGLSILAIKKLYELSLIKEFCIQNIIKSIFSTIWKGRMEEVEKDVYIDGAHNEDGILEFTKNLRFLCNENNKKATLLISIVADKDIEAMLKNFEDVARYISKIYIAKMDNYRAEKTRNIALILEKYVHIDFVEKDSIILAYDTMLKKKRDDELCFCVGSLYMIGEILSYLERKDKC